MTFKAFTFVHFVGSDCRELCNIVSIRLGYEVRLMGMNFKSSTCVSLL